MLDFNSADELINFKASNQILDQLIGQISSQPGTALDYAAQATRGVLGFGKDIVMGLGEIAYEGVKAVPKLIQLTETQNGQLLTQLDAQIVAENIRLGNITPGTVGQQTLDIGKAIVKPVTDPWSKGQYLEAGTRGVAEAATFALSWLKGSKAAQAAKAADTVKAEEAEKAAEALKAQQAEQKSQAAAEAVEQASGDGVHVKAPVIYRGTIKYRTAEDANAELIDRHRATPETPPFKEGTLVKEREMVPGERFKMSMDDQQLDTLNNPAKSGGVGGWGTTDTFTSQNEALNKLAINPEWKPNGIPNTVEFEVVKPFRTLEGIAGSQGVLTGGGQQYFLDLPRVGAKEFVRVVNVTNLP